MKTLIILMITIIILIVTSINTSSSLPPSVQASFNSKSERLSSLSRSRRTPMMRVMKQDRVFLYIGQSLPVINNSLISEPVISDDVSFMDEKDDTFNETPTISVNGKDVKNESLSKTKGQQLLIIETNNVIKETPINETLNGVVKKATLIGVSEAQRAKDKMKKSRDKKDFTSNEIINESTNLNIDYYYQDQDNDLNAIHREDADRDTDDVLSAFNVPEGVKIKISNVISDPLSFLQSFVIFPDNETSTLSTDNDLDVISSNTSDEVSVSGLSRGYQTSDSDSSSVSVPTSKEGGKRKLKLPKISSPAGCATELRTIEIKDEAEDSDLYYPWCVRLPRCSGCCPSTRLKCIPTNTSIVDIVAVKLHYANFNQKFKYEGMRIFKMEQHNSCRCECIQQAKDCNEYQKYRPEECRCVCNDPIRRAEECSRSDKIWNPETCECLCRYKHTCTTGTRFNHKSCRCEIDAQLIPVVNELKKLSDAYKIPKLSPVIDTEFKRQQDARAPGFDTGINPDFDNDKDAKYRFG